MLLHKMWLLSKMTLRKNTSEEHFQGILSRHLHSDLVVSETGQMVEVEHPDQIGSLEDNHFIHLMVAADVRLQNTHTKTLSKYLTLLMLSLLLSKAQECKNLRKTSKPCHIGIHLKALAEYSQLSTHVPGFQSFIKFFASFYIMQISHQQHKG